MPLPNRSRCLWILAFLALCPQFAVASTSAPGHDAAFQEGWSLLQKERYAEARAAFAKIPPLEYDLGDYVVYFGGEAAAREGKRTEAAESLRLLKEKFPDSPLLPYLLHEVAYAAALDNDVAASREAFGLSRGKVGGSRRKAEEGYVAAFLAGEAGPTAEAATMDLENFSAYTAREAGVLSFERLWKWRADGFFEGWNLSPGFYAKFAKAAARAGEAERARALFEEAISRFPPSGEYFALVLDYAEFHRKQGETAAAAALSGKAPGGRPGGVPVGGALSSRAGRVEGGAARRGAQGVSRNRGGGCAPRGRRTGRGTSPRGSPRMRGISRGRRNRSNASGEPGTIRSGRRRASGSPTASTVPADTTRRSRRSTPGKREEGVRWSAPGTGTGRRGRCATPEGGRRRSRSSRTWPATRSPGSTRSSRFRTRGAATFRILNASSTGETKACGEERERLWARIRKADWGPADAEKVRRAERLTLLGVVDYAVLEAERVDRTAARKAIGMGNGGAPGLFRYLAGDLKGGINETSNVPLDPMHPGLVDRIQYPLAPEFLADCDRRRSGIDPLVLHAVIRQESRFQADVLSPAGAVGLMQLMPRTAAEVARKEKMPKPGRKDLLRPSVNIHLGAAYLSRLVNGNGGDYFRAVAAYNAGETAVKRWWKQANGDPAAFLEGINYKETRFYLRRVFLNLLQYYRIYRPEMFARYFPKPPAEAKTAADAAPPPPPAAPADNVLSPPPTPEAVPTEPPPPQPPAGTPGGR